MMEAGGASNGSLSKSFYVNYEIFKILFHNKLFWSIFFIPVKILIRLNENINFKMMYKNKTILITGGINF